jgi:hypothetical protein
MSKIVARLFFMHIVNGSLEVLEKQVQSSERDRCFLKNIVITHSFALYRFCVFLICDVHVANLVEVLVPNLNCGCIAEIKSIRILRYSNEFPNCRHHCLEF